MRSTFLFNNNWLYKAEQVGEEVSDSQFEMITIPHTNKVFPHHNFDNREYQFISTYRKRFRLPEPLNGRRLYLDFDGAMIAATVTVNGHTFEEHKGGYTPFSFDITDFVDEANENLVVVHLDSTERKDIPPYGYVIDYLLFGGIYRDVRLRYVSPVHIHNVFIRPQDVLSAPWVEADVWVQNQSNSATHVDLTISINRDGALIAQVEASVEVPAYETVKTTVQLENLSDIHLWTLDNPILYHVNVTLRDDTDSVDEYKPVAFGFREVRFEDDGFYFNGKLLKLVGLNRHQMFPYVGQAAPQRLQEKDADIVKYELGCNLVRTSHYPQSPYFLDRCDEIGLLVFEEIPGWQHIGDKDWQSISLRDVQVMIERDWNHPSIIIWGVRINESLDDTEFYTATNALAHKLDPTRQTGGVRFWQHSEFLEDVYTFNDFSNGIEEPLQTPHLVTEFNGHMFPTKTWDGEERAVEHAIRHARVQSQQLGTGGVAGAIGWCAFDYNTHKEFGSGDRICYHGVMDIFRLPKFAASFYASQMSPEKKIILQPATYWTMGDRSEGGNNPVTVFSNCDEIEVFIGDRLHGRFQPDENSYPNLPHPPFTIPLEMVWGSTFHDFTLVGYYQGNKVAKVLLPIGGLPAKLELWTDSDELLADCADMTRLAFRIVDEYGNRLPYTNQIVTISVEGPVELIGENPFALMGGQGALYLKSTREVGEVSVTATSPRLEPQSVQIRIIEPKQLSI